MSIFVFARINFFYEEDKEVYYMALAAFDKTEKIDGFRKYFRYFLKLFITKCGEVLFRG